MKCVTCNFSMSADSRFCPMCGSPVQDSGVSREARKNVTVLFIDIVGSTALGERLDPEPLRRLLDRYFAACVSAISEHGGAVEKFIGDAVLAVFGARIAHEDDAVRAVRAAARSLTALRDLSREITESHGVSLEARCGLCSGEVVVITAPDGDFRVIGDVVNTASRLQNAAQPGQILIGEQAAAMVRGHVGIELVSELRLKGKAAPVSAWRVTAPVLDAGDGSPMPSAPLIGRDDELEELNRSLRRVTQRGQVCMVTVLGAPGIGKTRLVKEFVAGLPNGTATVLSGRCSAYGRGITYAPLVSMIDALPGGWDGLARRLSNDCDMGERAIRGLAAIMRRPSEPVTRTDHVAQADQFENARDLAAGTGAPVGVGGQTGVEEISWATRYMLEMLGKEGPVIMIWDDLHWAEATLLNLIDDAATWLTDVPLLLLCVARTELLETRPAWGGGKPCAATQELGSLTYEQSATLVSELVLHGDVYPQARQEAYARVAAECDGNPLFAELMLDVVTETAPEAQIPPTIHALLSARLDQLPDAERELVEMAAVIGREFAYDTLLAMAEDEGVRNVAVGDLVTRLTRRRIFQRIDRGNLRFRQALLRDTAYALTPKTRRERRHIFLAECFAGQADGVDTHPERDDRMVFAWHVEIASVLKRDLEPGSTGLPVLASVAADVLIDEGEQALKRKDLPAAAALLERGRGLLAPDDPRCTQVALHACDSWLGLWDADRSLAALSMGDPSPEGDPRALVTRAIQRSVVALRLGLATPDEVAADAERIAAELQDAGDDLAWCRYHQLQAYLHLACERAAAADASLRLSLERAQAMGDVYEEERLLCAICEVAQWTPTHLDENLRLCAVLAHRFADNRALLVPVLVTQAYLMALAGHLEDAHRAMSTARMHASDLHLDLADAVVLEMSGIVESLHGAHFKAETYFRRAAAALRTAPHAPDAGTADAAAARELFRQGRLAEAAEALDRLAQGGPGVHLRARIVTTALRGRLASSHGRHDEAGALAVQARELSDSVDDPCLAGEVLFDLAIVLRAAGRPDRAANSAAQALERFAAKGAALLASRVRDWMSAATNEAVTGDGGGAASSS
jgi:class 3 adenylate cyclase/tetratricopeptide (TPR) repeat protein